MPTHAHTHTHVRYCLASCLTMKQMPYSYRSSRSSGPLHLQASLYFTCCPLSSSTQLLFICLFCLASILFRHSIFYFLYLHPPSVWLSAFIFSLIFHVLQQQQQQRSLDCGSDLIMLGAQWLLWLTTQHSTVWNFWKTTNVLYCVYTPYYYYKLQQWVVCSNDTCGCRSCEAAHGDVLVWEHQARGFKWLTWKHSGMTSSTALLKDGSTLKSLLWLPLLFWNLPLLFSPLHFSLLFLFLWVSISFHVLCPCLNTSLRLFPSVLHVFISSFLLFSFSITLTLFYTEPSFPPHSALHLPRFSLPISLLPFSFTLTFFFF